MLDSSSTQPVWKILHQLKAEVPGSCLGVAWLSSWDRQMDASQEGNHKQSETTSPPDSQPSRGTEDSQ